jgi:hypothetical protein
VEYIEETIGLNSILLNTRADDYYDTRVVLLSASGTVQRYLEGKDLVETRERVPESPALPSSTSCSARCSYNLIAKAVQNILRE